MANSQKQSEEDLDKELQTKFEEEIKKPYYDVFYLDNFKLPYDKLDVSAVIATYNRCPYKPGTLKENRNPLVWSIKSCLYQKPQIKEIIIVDDNSNDYTEEVVKAYKEIIEKEDIKLIYVKNKKKLGPGIARNIGSKKSNSKYLYFLDDDAFIPPYAVFGSVFTVDKLSEKGIRVGAINLPTYQRASIPSKAVGKSEIGDLDFVKGIFKTNKGAFPSEYFDYDANEKFLDAELHILKPFSILNLNTTSLLCLRGAFEEVQGFREHYLNRGEDREFGCRIVENGYSIYFQPDIKFHCVHGSYGLDLEKEFEGNDWFKKLDRTISLKKAMKICDDPKEDSGTRVDPLEYVYQTMIADFFLTYQRNKKGAINWIKRMYKRFVKEADENFLGNNSIDLPNEKEREKLLNEVIYDGLSLIKKEEKGNIKKINQTLRKLKQDKKIDQDILNTLERLE